MKGKYVIMLYFKAVIEGADIGICFRAGFPEEDRMREELNNNTWEGEILKEIKQKCYSEVKGYSRTVYRIPFSAAEEICKDGLQYGRTHNLTFFTQTL